MNKEELLSHYKPATPKVCPKEQKKKINESWWKQEKKQIDREYSIESYFDTEDVFLS